MTDTCSVCGTALAGQGICVNPNCSNPVLSLATGAEALPKAALWRRLLASGLEFVIFFVVEVCTGMIAGAFLLIPLIGWILSPLLGGAFSALATCYWIFKDADGGRMSIGKRVGSMRIVDVRTHQLSSTLQGILRNSNYILAWVIALLPIMDVFAWILLISFAVIDVLMIALNPEGRRLGDFIAGTQVVPASYVR